MNFYNIINEIEKTDPEVYERLDGRRGTLKQLTGFAGKVAAMALPFSVLGTLFRKAYGQTAGNITDVLNFALTLEYLESEFYKAGVSASNLIPAADKPGFTTIRDHEAAHVAALTSIIKAMGATPVNFTAASFDFTAKGAFADVFSNYTTFLAVSQSFEDTGVRAYKGQAANLMSNNDVLTAALQIHSVEARHAAHVRQLRAQKPWITGNNSGGAPAAIYAGEDNTTQGGVSITAINGMGVSANAASEAFDEPLTKDQVTSIVTPFFK